MSEINAIQYCPNCKKEAECMFSGSGKDGSCMECDSEIGDLKEFDRIVSHSVY